MPCRLQFHSVRFELICSLVWIFKYGIVEIQIESQDGIRNGHLHERLLDLHLLSLIITVHFHLRIKILGRSGHGTCRKSR